MESKVDKLFEECRKQNDFLKNHTLVELTPQIENALKLDIIDILNVLGVAALPKLHTDNIIFKHKIIVREQYRAMWLIDGLKGIHAIFHSIIKEVLINDFGRIRFKISLTLSKLEPRHQIRDYHEFEIHFYYFGNKKDIFF